MPAVSREPKVQMPRYGGVVVPHKPKWHQRLAAALIYGLIRAVSATIRYEWQDNSGLLAINRDQSVIFAI